jgi:alpha-beta hydrolase superfamily lysophospholipase
MKIRSESVSIQSLGDELVGTLFIPETEGPSPALILCHGAGDFRENYFEMSERLAERGIVSLALDMHGHGASGGERFHVDMRQWAADVRAAVDYLQTRPEVNGDQIGGFGLSSGGTAILEAALVDKRLRALIPLDATVRNSLPLPMSWFIKSLLLLGKIKLFVTKKTLRLPLAKMCPAPILASDRAVNREILDYPRSWEGFNSFPLPGGEHAFFVDTIERVSRITAPTLVLWGEDDKVDPPETARQLYAALTCKRELHIIPGNGHVGHRDRHKERVFALTADWILQNVAAAATESVAWCRKHGIQNHRCGCSQEARVSGEMEPALAVS